ncbi:hypothetical protein AB7M63_005774 [Bradyrhizobium japonicum]
MSKGITNQIGGQLSDTRAIAVDGLVYLEVGLDQALRRRRS